MFIYSYYDMQEQTVGWPGGRVFFSSVEIPD